MDKPTKCRIGVKTYEILWQPAQWSKDTGLIGQHDPVKYIIQILDESIQPLGQAHVFMHEAMHALFDVIPEELLTDGKMSEEVACDVVAHQLTCFFVDNPHIFDWYSEAIKCL